MASDEAGVVITPLTESQLDKIRFYARENDIAPEIVMRDAVDAYLDSSRAMGDMQKLTGENTAQFSIDVHPPLCTVRTIGHEFTVTQETAKRLIGKRIEIAVYVERGGDDD